MMSYQLSAEEARVLGVLIEKQLTTPDYYPMTVNALKNGCNQKSNRQPVVNYDETTVLRAIDSLRNKGLIITVSGSGSRIRKYDHKLKDTLFLSKKGMAVLGVLLLRGAQTVGEIRQRTDRMVDFASLEEVQETLADLANQNRSPQPLGTKLHRQPGQKEYRYAHLLCGEPEMPETDLNMASSSLSPNENQLEKLEERVKQLEIELTSLNEEFQQFKKQFE